MKNNFFLPVFYKEDLKLNLIFKDYLEQHQDWVKFPNGGKVSVFYGMFPEALWNGGRFYPGWFPKMSEEEIKEIIEIVNSRGISVRITFSNMLLKKHHLKDEYCNMILRLLDNNCENGVIVASDILEDYIAETHPNLELISSITKGNDFNTFITSWTKGIYNMIVAYPKHNILKYIQQHIPLKERSKIEILGATACVNCPITHEHYYYESLNNFIDDKKDFICYKNRGGVEPSIDLDSFPIYDFNLLNKLGLYNFKLQGRGRTIDRLIHTYVDFIFESQYYNQAVKELSELYYNNFN